MLKMQLAQLRAETEYNCPISYLKNTHIGIVVLKANPEPIHQS